MEVFVGGLWHQYCDPFCTVYATTRETVQTKLDENEEEEYQRMLQDCDCPDCDHESLCDSEDCECESECCENDIMTGGIWAEDMTEEELKQALGYGNEGEFRYSELIELGYAYGGH